MHEPVEQESTQIKIPIQLRLFPPAKPLLERFGQDFFRKVPPSPGVYLMAAENHRLLYIGQSHNLRERLNSYKNLNPERASRKLVRLVHRVRSITWEVCETPEQAQLRENELLRLFKPTLNVVNTRPEHYAFIGMRTENSSILLRVTKSPQVAPGESLYGAFKGVWSVRLALAALLRCFWALDTPTLHPHHLPSILLKDNPPEQYSWDMTKPGGQGLGEPLELYLSGKADGLVVLLSDRLSRREGACPFLIRLWEQDLERLNQFYRFGPKRTEELRQKYGISSQTIPPADLDDLLVLKRLEAAERKIQG